MSYLQKTIKKEIKEMIELVLWLIFLGAIVEVTGTTFFGINLLPLIILAIIIAIIVKDYQSKCSLIKKIKKLFKNKK